MRLLVTSLLISLLSVVTSANKKTQYKDFLLSDNAVWALTADGEISVIDLASKKVRRTIKNDVAVTHLAKDRTGAIVIVDKANQLKTYNKATGSWQPMQTIKHKMFGLVFDSQNRAYAVTDKGIQELATGEIYFSKLSRLDNQTMHEDRWEGLSCFHMDKDNNIWVGFDFGEWGGKLFIFDTGKKTFVKPTLDELDERLYPVQSFSEDSTFVYVSAAMSHMMTSGSISRFKNFQETLLFESKAHLSEPVKVGTGTEMYTIHGEGIQSLVCSSYDNAMYFASQNGIFRGEVPRGPIEAQHWQHIATNDVGAKKSSPKAVLVPHNINKIASLKKNTLVFLAQFDGIGILENGRVTMLN